MLSRRVATFLAFMLFVLFGAGAAAAQDRVLPSWNDGATRSAILDFVARVTAAGPDYVVPEERIAVFDNDGTLWSEQPVYFQLAFAIERGRALALSRRELAAKQPFKALIDRDRDAFAAAGEKAVLDVMAVTHAGMTTEEFNRDVL